MRRLRKLDSETLAKVEVHAIEMVHILRSTLLHDLRRGRWPMTPKLAAEFERLERELSAARGGDQSAH